MRPSWGRPGEWPSGSFGVGRRTCRPRRRQRFLSRRRVHCGLAGTRDGNLMRPQEASTPAIWILRERAGPPPGLDVRYGRVQKLAAEADFTTRSLGMQASMGTVILTDRERTPE